MNGVIGVFAATFVVSVSSLSSAEGLFFDSDDVRIHYVDLGAGEPVVLVHGFTASLEMWNVDDIMKNLAQDYRVIALDVRGHGLSGKPHVPEAYGPKMAEDIIRLLDHLEVKKAHMVGYSMGAYIIGRLLVTNPDRVLTATLGSGAFPNWSSEDRKFAEEQARATEERGRAGQLYPWETADQDFVALAACARGTRYEAVTDEEIARIYVPMLAIYGSVEKDEEELFFSEDLKRLALPKSALPHVVVPGATHAGEQATFRRPEFIETVRHLVESN